MNSLPLAHIASFLGPGNEIGEPTAPGRRVEVSKKTEVVRSKQASLEKVRLIIFSKDRPFQLKNCLQSCRECLKECTLDIVVLWQAEDTVERYECLIREERQIRFQRETKEKPLSALLSDNCFGQKWLLFCVDDLFMYRAVDLSACVQALNENEHILCVQLKLNPHICWSQAASLPSPPPAALCSFNSKLLSWRFDEAKGDWAYPFDLCGSLYRGNDLNTIISKLDQAALNHPNRFEAAAGKEIRSIKRSHGLCPIEPVLCVVTVNRVQNIFSAPIYQCDYTLEELNALKTSLDPQKYRAHRYSSVHVGDLHLTVSGPLRSNQQVTFVVPARNAEKTISACVTSALRQGSRLAEFILVDDASSDNTIQVATEAAGLDSRFRVLRLSTHSGVAAALNAGLEVTKTPYFARLDADDICLTDDRLSRQLDFIDAHPQVQVLGTGTHSSREPSDQTTCYAVRPCQPLLVAWGLHFSCCIAHPSVLCRTEALRSAGGYRGSSYAEDYELWLRLTDDQPSAIANLSEPLVWLRKSDTSISASHRDAQREDADAALTRAYSRRVQRDVERDVANALRRPEACVSATTLRAAAQLLLELEHTFLSSVALSPDASGEATRIRALVEIDVNAHLAEIALAAARLSTDEVDKGAAAACAKMLTDRDSDAMSTFLGALCRS